MLELRMGWHSVVHLPPGTGKRAPL